MVLGNRLDTAKTAAGPGGSNAADRKKGWGLG